MTSWNPMDAGHARAKTRKRSPEADLQAQVIRMLAASLPPGSIWWHTPNEGKRGWAAQAEFKRLGGRAGIPDLTIIHDGRALFIELKAPKGRVTRTQADMHAKLQAAGCDVLVARSVEEVMTWLADRLPMRGRIAA